MNTKHPFAFKNRNSFRVVLIVLLAVCLCIAFAVFFYETSKTLSQETEKNLKESIDLSRDSLQLSISNTFTQLEMMAELCDNPQENKPEDCNWYEIINSGYTDAYRIGVANAQGTIYYGDGKRINISGNPSYKELLQGKKVTSSVAEKDLGGKDALVLGVPIFKDEQVVGAVCAEYTQETLGKMVNTRETKGVGATLVFQKDGRLVASYPGMENYNTIYAMLETMTFENGASVSDMQKQVQENKSGVMQYNNKGVERLLYYTPVGNDEWYIVSIVDANSFQRSAHQINKNGLILAIAAGILFLMILILFSRILTARRNEMMELQRDPLTGAWSRKWAEEKVRRSMKEKADSAFYNCCIFLDVDDFKKINDSYGHLIGDQRLRHLAALLKESLREDDIVSRYGGDEFCLWLWNIAKSEHAKKIAENLITEVRQDGQMRISVGVTIYREEDTCDAMVKRADEALYMAKEKGKDQVVIF